jgi:hypothetical protein
MVTINIGRKEAIFFGAVILVFVVAGLVVAYNSGNPSVHGHDANEIANLPVGNGSGGSFSFGDMEARNNEQVYLAATDGFIVTSSNWAYNEVYVGSSSSSLSVVAREAPASQGPQPSWGSMSIPVKKGLYWKVVARTDSTPIIYWVPVNGGGSGSSSCSWVVTSSPTISSSDFINNGGTGTCWYQEAGGAVYWGYVRGGTADKGWGQPSEGVDTSGNPLVYCNIFDEDGSSWWNNGVVFHYYACK